MISALFALMLVAEATPHHDVAATDTPAAVQVKKEKKVCRTDESATGSRMRKKICLTQSQWEQRDSGKSAADLKTLGGQ